MKTFTKDPDARLDYTEDWSAWMATGDVITAATWTVAAGLTTDLNTFSDTSTTIWLSGGTVGQSYLLTCHIATQDGRQDDRSFQIKVAER